LTADAPSLCTGQHQRILGWRGDVPAWLFDAADVGARSPVSSMRVERCDSGPNDGVRRRTLRSHVLTQFVRGGVIEHAAAARPVQRIVVPREAVVCSLRDVEEEVRFAHDTELFAVELSDDFLAATARGLHDRDDFALKPSPGLRDRRLSGLMMAMRVEQAAGWPAGPLFAECIQQAIATLLMADPPSFNVGTCALSTAAARRVEALVEDSLSTPLLLADLAAAAGYSVAQFVRLFRERFGTSPHRYVTARRIERARTLLREGRLSQIEVAIECGFQSQQHFSRVFRKQVGISPKDYRSRPIRMDT
jgi:AraC family transcriptional regulator